MKTTDKCIAGFGAAALGLWATLPNVFSQKNLTFSLFQNSCSFVSNIFGSIPQNLPKNHDRLFLTLTNSLLGSLNVGSAALSLFEITSESGTSSMQENLVRSLTFIHTAYTAYACFERTIELLRSEANPQTAII